MLILIISCRINSYSAGIEKPLIFPIPSDVQMADGKFVIDKTATIIIPENASTTDDFLSRLLYNEIIDKYEQYINISKKTSYTDKDKFILVGDITNPLVKKYCEQKGWINTLKGLGDEGYILFVSPNNAVVAANTKNGALFGLSSLRQIISSENGKLSLPSLMVKDSPRYPFRGIRLYFPGRENFTFFKRFIRDFVTLYKFNTLILEMNANMRLDRHPELNIGAVQFERHLRFSRLDRPPGLHKEFQNSSHQDNADGQIIEKEEVADILSYIRKFNIEVIPEIPSLTHAYYLLAGHEELAENPNQPYPDTYCPLRPESYKLYFDVLDEYIEVMKPSIIHIGHDEWRMEKDVCELCKGKDYGRLFADDLNKIHEYLAKKGIKTAIWGDHLLESVRQKEFQVWKSSAGYQYKIPGALKPEQVTQLIPKDILIFNWFWDDANNDKQVSDFGFSQVYGNMRPEISNWDERMNTKGLMGGAPSSWAGTTEKNFGKDLIYEFLGCANLLWSKQYLPEDQLVFVTGSLIDIIYKNLSGKFLPTDLGSTVNPLDISSHFNSALSEDITGLANIELKTGNINSGKKIFNLSASVEKGKRGIIATTQKDPAAPKAAQVVEINKDVSSLLFLHACAKEGSNSKAYTAIFNFDDTAELLGWYEIVYEDGFIVTIPLRYGVNILDWKLKQRILNNEKDKSRGGQNKYTYFATAVECSKSESTPVTFYAFEWENPRFGKKIKEVNLKSVNYVKNENAIILLGVSIAENLKIERATGTEDE